MTLAYAASNSDIRITTAVSSREVAEFIELPYRLNGIYPHWVPPLRRDVRVLLNRMKHPFHQHAQVEYFLAECGGEVIGRIAAIENFAHNKHHGERVGFFGFLEAINDGEVFRELFAAAEDWCRRRKLTSIRGPFSFSTNEEAGLLVENFHSTPLLMMPFHPAYYQRRIEEAGYDKAEDLLCFWQTYDTLSEKMLRLAEGAEQRLLRSGVRLRTRTIDMNRWNEEIKSIQHIYNTAWADNWGFVPLTDQEMEFIARELKPFANPDLIIFAEVDENPAAFILSMPDFNTILKHLEGKIGPKQILLFLLLRNQIRQVRLMMMGVMPEFRGKGIELILYRETTNHSIRHGFHAGELSWILEGNKPMVRQIEAMGAKMYRRYRVFEKGL